MIEHEKDADLAWLGEWFEDAGLTVEVVRPFAGETVPAEVTHDALVVLGGSMGAYDDVKYTWLTDTKALLRAYVGAEVPCLGVCLGHQLLTVACGGEVQRNPDGRQRGALAVGFQREAAEDPLFGPLPTGTHAVQWNGDVVTALPPGAVLLAESADGHPQAARVGPKAWSIQFHPEAGAEKAEVWAKLESRGADHDDATRDALATVREHEDEMRQTWSAFAGRFATLAGA